MAQRGDGAVLVTGTSSGIGAATAIAAAQAGYTVVATLRDPTRAGRLRDAAEAAGVPLDIRPLDVTDDASVMNCVADTVAAHGGLHAVINNAGAGHVGTLEIDPLELTRAVFEVNFFGVLRVSRAAMPHLRSGGGRLITVSSVGGVVGQPFNEAYCAAKFAVEGFMESLAPVAAVTGVAVSIVEPGAVASDFVAAIDLTGDHGPYQELFDAYRRRTEGAFAQAQSSQDVAAVMVQVLTAPHPALRYQTSAAASQFAAVKLADLDGSAVVGLTSTWLSA
ncbi:NAD(P)-dependent dehydrogenase (short-subunit alcohol dehydrogenase family) [Allocatelliglobosispora scoriae]|uniref:NAD(P)-dependent dehydrogenase (Short-subunit alcohol dehydrogenase family) n=1 Tax=Allocatelliglobosispora scoriae TaxID=643052 RepID=A0A841BI38_9ACTN|nr:NAD(P)-dependent dehydrogenase (short-subunit alcohol dehydrogenase family) [Allocatelliglobosispora scoriae]